MGAHDLIVRGARENNLKAVDLEVPHNKLVVVTGLSGSGKSSLAFDTVYAEGQRRYIETFSPYTRQFFDKVKKPDVDLIDNVRPAVAIEQRTRVTNSRSTIGSMTNINDYLKILWSNLAQPHCIECGQELSALDSEGAAKQAIELVQGINNAKWGLVAPVRVTVDTKQRSKKARNTALQLEMERLQSLGYTRYINWSDRQILEYQPGKLAEQDQDGMVAVLLDRFRNPIKDSARLADAFSQAFDLGSNSAALIPLDVTLKEHWFYRGFRCQQHPDKVVPRVTPGLFSYNSPIGACPKCNGFGRTLAIDIERCIPNKTLSIAGGAIQCWTGAKATWERRQLFKFCESQSISTVIPWAELSKEIQDQLLYTDTKAYCGVVPWFEWLEKKIYKMHVRVFLARYRSQVECVHCQGKRLQNQALSFLILGRTIADLWLMPLSELREWLELARRAHESQLSEARQLREVFDSLMLRVDYLITLGLPYVSLDRQARTLSGGETQRVNLAAALGSQITSTQFVLDEPTVGLHSRDTGRLIDSLKHLSRRGNSLLVVEHDIECIEQAEHIVEIGPGSGSFGGQVTYSGAKSGWRGLDLSRLETRPKQSASGQLTISDVSIRNLERFNLELPLGLFVVLAGVSGSGKSTLAHEVIKRGFDLWRTGDPAFKDKPYITGFEQLDQVLVVDQSPLAKSPRANVATYVGIWDRIRLMLAQSSMAVERGLTKSSFSFNVDGGRCPVCRGAGFIREDMQFLSDVYIPCEICLGKRFQAFALEVKWKGYNVDDYLNMSVDDLFRHSESDEALRRPLELLIELGLGYLRLGHSLSELSGGEAQRLKLVDFLANSKKSSPGAGPLLIFDEPTTGLHVDDIRKLINLFWKLRERGATILCVEHSLFVMAHADWIVELGPEGGASGGKLVNQGAISDFVKADSLISPTAECLRDFLKPKKESISKNSSPVSRGNAFRANSQLEIRGARVHNLKNIDLEVPLNKIVAICGVSGSGKSSIAKDIIYAEGQRRYLDCLSPYARQFIKELARPEIDSIDNIMPTICVYQHTFQPGRNSTVGTMSECYNFLRLLFSKLGIQHCPKHPDETITPLTAEAIASEIRDLSNQRIRILAPIIKHKKGHHRALIERAIASEIDEIRVDGVFARPSRFIEGLERNKVHTIEYSVASFVPNKVDDDLINSATAQALSLGGGNLIIHSASSEQVYSLERTCPICKSGFFRPDPEDLSFHSKRGACEKCLGTGLRSNKPCSACGGARLGSLGLNLRLAGLNIGEVSKLLPKQVLEFLEQLKFSKRVANLAETIIGELRNKLETLLEIGLGYIALDRACSTLSNGELQRLRLATAMGSPLSGVMYILDEPSAGLHPHDNALVLNRLSALRSKGNSVLVIEHDYQTIMFCDHVIEVGPGGGSAGGEIVFNDSASKYVEHERKGGSGVNMAVSASESLSSDSEQSGSTDILQIINANCNNVVGLNLDLPLRKLVVVAGVSGAGKSSLVHGVIADAISGSPNTNWKIKGSILKSTLKIERMISVDQKPIGKNSRSTPASYLKIWDQIRSLYAGTVEAKAQGWKSGFFSYNSGKGRCQHCSGLGYTKLEMSFLPDAQIECEVCLGSRYGEEALGVLFLGASISDILGLTFDQARIHFAHHKKIHQVLHLACELGLGYLTLGQSSSTLSGGESQRIKLVAELSGNRRGHTIYILDEPTTGLHRKDVVRLLGGLRRLVAQGHSVLVIEHDQQLVSAADYLIEMGPGAGDEGGQIVFAGTPSELCGRLTPWGQLLGTTEHVESIANLS